MFVINYFDNLFSDSEFKTLFTEERMILSWLQTEVALAIAQEQLGMIPTGTAVKIQSVATLENLNLAQMKKDFDRVGFPILPFVAQLTKACGPDTGRWVHYGATTQDILDTGTVLQMRDAITWIEAQLTGILKALAKLSREHQLTVMAGRTFQQQAAPITFGYKAAIWLDELMRQEERLAELKKRLLVGQCSGAVGTFATLGDRGLEVQKLMFHELGLNMPLISWHVARDNWAEMVHWLASTAASLAKIATEITILMRSEIGELSEPFETGRGASTTLPQKRNPIACEPIVANAHKLRELVGSQLISMIQEHERGALGQMHLEWMVIPEAFLLFSGSLKHSRFILENLWVGSKQMRQNLDIGGGLLMSEAVMMGLAPKIGKAKAHHVVYAAAGKAMDNGSTLREALLEDIEITTILSEAEIDELLNPVNYLGIAPAMVDAVLKKFNCIHV